MSRVEIMEALPRDFFTVLRPPKRHLWPSSGNPTDASSSHHTGASVVTHLQPRPSMRIKVLLLGESNSGKTSLVRAYRYEHNRASGHISEAMMDSFVYGAGAQYIPTVGVDFFPGPQQPITRAVGPSATFSGGIVRVVPAFFDLSGDLSFVKVRAEFYGDWNVLIFCFDITNKDTFTKLEHWVTEAEQVCLKPFICSRYTSNAYISTFTTSSLLSNSNN